MCCYSAFFTDHSGEFDIAIRIYRGIFLFVLVTFLLAVNTWGWRKAGVNHVLIFELDPRDHLSYQHLLEVRVFLTFYFTLTTICFFKSLLKSRTFRGISFFYSLLISGSVILLDATLLLNRGNLRSIKCSTCN